MNNIGTNTLVLIAVNSIFFGSVSFAAQHDAVSLFRANTAMISAEGIHTVEGFVFSTVRLPSSHDQGVLIDVSRDRASILAVRRFLEYRVETGLDVAAFGSGVKVAAINAGLSCLESSVNLLGIETVSNMNDGDSVLVVKAIPLESLEAVKFDRDVFITWALTRVKEGRASPIEAMLTLEILPDGDPRLIPVSVSALEILNKDYGAGIGLTLSRKWTLADSQMCTKCLENWCSFLSRNVGSGAGIEMALSPLQSRITEQLNIVELLELLGTRMQDPSVLKELLARLRASGWDRTAYLFDVKPLELTPFVDLPETKLSRDLRARVVSTPIVTLLLLSNGQADVKFLGHGPSYVRGLAAYDRGGSNDMIEAVEQLTDDLTSSPSIDSISLLGAVLVKLNDPAIAYPICAAAFQAMPEHQFAGINLLRAAQAMDRRDLVRELLPKVSANTHLNDWGKKKVLSIKDWLDSQASPAAPDAKSSAN